MDYKNYSHSNKTGHKEKQGKQTKVIFTNDKQPMHSKLKTTLKSQTKKSLDEPHPVKSLNPPKRLSRDELAKILLRKPTQKDQKRIEKRHLNPIPNYVIPEKGTKQINKNSNGIGKFLGNNDNNISIFVYNVEEEKKAELNGLDNRLQEVLDGEGSVSGRGENLFPTPTPDVPITGNQQKTKPISKLALTAPRAASKSKKLFDSNSKLKLIPNNVPALPFSKSQPQKIPSKLNIPEESKDAETLGSESSTEDDESSTQYDDDDDKTDYFGDDEGEKTSEVLKKLPGKSSSKTSKVKVKPDITLANKSKTTDNAQKPKVNSKKSLSKWDPIKRNYDNNYDPNRLANENDEEEEEKQMKEWFENQKLKQKLESKEINQGSTNSKGPKKFVMLWDHNLDLTPKLHYQPKSPYYIRNCDCKYAANNNIPSQPSGKRK